MTPLRVVVIASVPLDVIGEPEMLKPLGTVAATLVTVPVPEVVAGAHVVPFQTIACPEVAPPWAIAPKAMPPEGREIVC